VKPIIDYEIPSDSHHYQILTPIPNNSIINLKTWDVPFLPGDVVVDKSYNPVYEVFIYIDR